MSHIEERKMRVTNATDYAVRCLLYMCSRDSGEVVKRREIAQMMEIPNEFLLRIAHRLSRAGFIEILQGSLGGFRINRKPREINLLDVMEAMEGPLCLSDCVRRERACQREGNDCPVHPAWQAATDQLRATLRKTTFDSLIAA
jgi:Rrf2 family iron-sulfur cluster assembly transcriptional regulator